MARPPKPVDLRTGHLTKAEIESRKKAEESLKGLDDEIDKIPQWLDKDAKKIYKWLIKQLKEIGILTNLDIEIVAICADAQAKMHQANKLIQEQGLIVTHINRSGATTYIENPAIKIFQKYQQIYQKNIQELGLSPSARAKMSLIKVEQDKNSQDPLLKILSEEDDEDEI